MLIMLGHDFLFNGQEYYLENHSLLTLLFLLFLPSAFFSLET